MARLLTTLGVVCLFSTTGMAEDRPDLIPNDHPSTPPGSNGVDVEIATEPIPSTWRN
jgi:hypothetical protein